MILLGIDPGLANFGWANYDLGSGKFIDLGVIHTKKSDKKRRVLASDDNVRRARELSEAIWQINHDKAIDVICAESMSFPRSSSVAAKMAIAWGVLAAKADAWNIPIVQASPQEIKRSVCGAANASKDDILLAVLEAHPETFEMGQELIRSECEHAFDAAAAVLACLNSDVVKALRRAA